MNPYQGNIDKLKRQLIKLKDEERSLRDQFLSGRNFVELRAQLDVIDEYLQKTRKYNYWAYFINDWGNSIERNGLRKKIESILYVEILGLYPLENLLNKAKKNLEMENPWSTTKIQQEIDSSRKRLIELEGRRYFKSQVKIDEIAQGIEKLERELVENIENEKQTRFRLEYGRSVLRDYISSWKKVVIIQAKIAKVKQNLDIETPYEEIHELAYAKAAELDGKTRSMAGQKKHGIEKTSHCPYCEDPLGEDPHLDHIQPVNRGGLSISQNLVWSCSKCNLSKSNKGLIEFLLYNELNIDRVCNRLLALGKKV